MTTTRTLPAHEAPPPSTDPATWADELGRAVAPHVARHDADGT